MTLQQEITLAAKEAFEEGYKKSFGRGGKGSQESF